MYLQLNEFLQEEEKKHIRHACYFSGQGYMKTNTDFRVEETISSPFCLQHSCANHR